MFWVTGPGMLILYPFQTKDVQKTGFTANRPEPISSKLGPKSTSPLVLSPLPLLNNQTSLRKTGFNQLKSVTNRTEMIWTSSTFHAPKWVRFESNRFWSWVEKKMILYTSISNQNFLKPSPCVILVLGPPIWFWVYFTFYS